MWGVRTTLSIAHERMVDGEVLPDEVVEARAAEVAGLQRGDERVGVVEHRPGRVQVDRRRRACGRTAARRSCPVVSGRDHGVHRHDVGLGEQVVEGVGRVRAVRVVAR